MVGTRDTGTEGTRDMGTVDIPPAARVGPPVPRGSPVARVARVPRRCRRTTCTTTPPMRDATRRARCSVTRRCRRRIAWRRGRTTSMRTRAATCTGRPTRAGSPATRASGNLHLRPRRSRHVGRAGGMVAAPRQRRPISIETPRPGRAEQAALRRRTAAARMVVARGVVVVADGGGSSKQPVRSGTRRPSSSIARGAFVPGDGPHS